MIIYIIIIIIILLIILLLKDIIKNSFINTNYKYTAVIIEPRKHKALKYVLNNFLENLNNDWYFIIMHGNLNEEYIDDIINNNLTKYKNRISKHNLKVDNLTILDYNNLLKSIELYDLIPTEMFLIFQTDTIICSKFKDNIYKFMNYDYVGAPWSWGEVGNGGLSLRKKSKMIEIINKCPKLREPKNINDIMNNEDVVFSLACEGVSINKPSVEQAKLFSLEHVYSPNSFGIHKAYEYLNSTELNNLKLYCPEIKELIELNN
jgi:hypothetical protein